MSYRLRKLKDTDRKAVIDIMDYFIKNSYAAYPEENIAEEHLKNIFETAGSYPFYIIESNNEVIGFGLMHPLYNISTFHHTAEITYFILPDYTNIGLGTKLLYQLLSDAEEIGIESIMASISSRNQESINFHLKHGFQECGRFSKVGKKFGKYFDMVWMQRFTPLMTD